MVLTRSCIVLVLYFDYINDNKLLSTEGYFILIET